MKSELTITKWLIMAVLLGIGLAACGPAQDPENEIATVTARSEEVSEPVEEDAVAADQEELVETETVEVEPARDVRAAVAEQQRLGRRGTVDLGTGGAEKVPSELRRGQRNARERPG